MATELINKDYFNVEVFGDYFTSTAQGNVLKPFGPVYLKMRSWESAQRLARFNILPVLLIKADPEFKSIRLCKIISVKGPDMKPVYGLPVKYMDRDQIEMECKSKGIPLRADMYSDIVELRGKLSFARENPKKFKDIEQRHIQAYSKIGDALEMNANIFTDLLEKNKGVDLLNKSLQPETEITKNDDDDNDAYDMHYDTDKDISL